MDVLIQDVVWEHGEQLKSGAIRIKNGFISDITTDIKAKKNEVVIEGHNAFLYPGLINSHDHLEMNIYPKLGTPPYDDYVAWANDIYRPLEKPISDIEALSLRDRLLFGAFRNIISGVTTVVHHNPYHLWFRWRFPISVFSKYRWIHSLAFGKKNQRMVFGKQKLIVHAAEGVSARAAAEIDVLDRSGYLGPQTILIHGIAVSAKQINRLRETGTSLVCCPSSNNFLFGKTAPINALKQQILVSIGTDSTLTGLPTLLDEVQYAVKTGFVSEREAFHMITAIPSRIFGLKNYPALTKGSPADLFLARRIKDDYASNLIALQTDDIRMVMHRGLIRLLRGNPPKNWPIHLKKSFISQNYICIPMSALMGRIASRVSSIFLQRNPLWKIAERWL